jgi:hypothetical protein
VILIVAGSALAVPGAAGSAGPSAWAPVSTTADAVSSTSAAASGLSTTRSVAGPSRATVAMTTAVGAAHGRRSIEAAPTGAYGVPTPALRAYHRAAATLAQRQPSCRLGWSLLAGIGLIESDHGRYGGAVVGVDGRSRPRILGPRLNGIGPVAAIHDSDRGRLDGDRVWDRAVGPMQFIPQTWASVGADGDGDGVENPDDIDDAALAAGYYLCASGGDLTDPSARRSALLSYNGSEVYAFVVASYAADYAAGVWPSTPTLPEWLQDVDPDEPPKPPAGLGDGDGGPGGNGPGNGPGHGGGDGDGPGNGPGPGGPGGPGDGPPDDPEPPDPPDDPDPVVTTKRVTLVGVPGQCSQGWCVGGAYAGALGAWPATADYDGDCRQEVMAGELTGMSAVGVVAQVTVLQTLVDKVLTKTETVGFSVPDPPVCDEE